jgi:L-ascorbate metabolism protein UlaG (beta-lactamase superfamily)
MTRRIKTFSPLAPRPLAPAVVVAALALSLAGCAVNIRHGGGSSMPTVATAPTPAGVEVLWLGQAAFKITSPGGKVIVIDPWLRTNPTTPEAYKKLEVFGRVDVLLVTHGHFDHIADAPALAVQYNVPLRAPGDLNATLGALAVLGPQLLPRMNKSGTVEAAPGIKVTAVRAEHSSVYNWKNPATGKDEIHPGGEAVGWIIELENGFRLYHAGDTGVFGDMRLIGQRYKPDLALVPIGGNFTMDPFDAAWAVKDLLRPKAVIPMHYGANPLAKGTAAQFIEAMGTGSGVAVHAPKPGEAVKF